MMGLAAASEPVRDAPAHCLTVPFCHRHLITCQCHFACCLCCRQNSLTAHLITPAKGAHFTMYLVQMKEGSKAAQLAPTIERQVVGPSRLRLEAEAELPGAAADTPGVQCNHLFHVGVVCVTNVLSFRSCCCRFVFVVNGEIEVKHGGKTLKLVANDYVYFPPGSTDT